MNWYSLTLVIETIILILLIWYISRILKKFLFISEHLNELLKEMNEFSDHIEKVHELEMFYGDPTLENLIHHSRVVVEDIKAFNEVYTISPDDDQGVNVENDREDPDETEEKED